MGFKSMTCVIWAQCSTDGGIKSTESSRCEFMMKNTTKYMEKLWRHTPNANMADRSDNPGLVA